MKGNYSIMTIEPFMDLLKFFIIYSFFGWVLESIFKTIYEKRLVNSGFLNGPFCPIYGIGAIIMLTFLTNYRNDYFVLFIMGFVILSVWEYIVGWALEKVFHTKYWDYTNNKFNIQGRVCLMNSIFWGILGVVFIIWIHPFVTNALLVIPGNIQNYITILITCYLIVDFTITAIKVTKINTKLNKLSEITSTLKEKLEELKDIGNIQEKGEAKLESAIAELKEKQMELKNTLDKQTARLRKAFPTMTSEKLSELGEFLNQRIENLKNDRAGKK